MEKQRVIYPIIIGLIVVGFFSCIIAFAIEGFSSKNLRTLHNSNYISESREVTGFDKVKLDGFADLEITQGDKESLTITASEEQMKSIQTEVVDQTLILNNTSDNKQVISINLFSIQNTPVKFKLIVKDLSEIDTKGAGNIVISDLTSKDLAIKMEGAGNMTANNLSLETVDILMKGAGNTDITGKANKLTLDMEGAGNFDGTDLIVKEINAKSKGAGNAVLNATETLDVTMTGFGNVNYYGNPKITDEITGLGNFKKISK